MNNIISFNYCGVYYNQIDYVIKKITKCKTIRSKLNKQVKIILGEFNSPRGAPIEFKYYLGNYIDCLNQGSNVLISVGDKYGCSVKLQIEILEKMGYNFIFSDLTNNNHISIVKLYQFAKQHNSKLNIITYTYYLIQGLLMIILIKKITKNIQRKTKGIKYNKVKDEIINKVQKTYSRDNLNIFKIIRIYNVYNKQIKAILTDDKQLY